MLTKIHTQNDDDPFDDRGILKDGRSVSIGLLMKRLAAGNATSTMSLPGLTPTSPRTDRHSHIGQVSATPWFEVKASG